MSHKKSMIILSFSLYVALTLAKIEQQGNNSILAYFCAAIFQYGLMAANSKMVLLVRQVLKDRYHETMGGTWNLIYGK
uniref:Uncharacterized protein n=1 Tax=Arundo donax TaxID=35708 RepID=A0A0A9CPF6_ARUDO